jgi:small redox-active disulfide protein 2
MLEIKVLGPGCTNCVQLEKMVYNACAELDLEADIQKITDINEFVKYGIMLTPGLVVNGKVLLQGRLPTKHTLEHWLQQANKDQ